MRGTILLYNTPFLTIESALHSFAQRGYDYSIVHRVEELLEVPDCPCSIYVIFGSELYYPMQSLAKKDSIFICVADPVQMGCLVNSSPHDDNDKRRNFEWLGFKRAEYARFVDVNIKPDDIVECLDRLSRARFLQSPDKKSEYLRALLENTGTGHSYVEFMTQFSYQIDTERRISYRKDFLLWLVSKKGRQDLLNLLTKYSGKKETAIGIVRIVESFYDGNEKGLSEEGSSMRQAVREIVSKMKEEGCEPDKRWVRETADEFNTSVFELNYTIHMLKTDEMFKSIRLR